MGMQRGGRPGGPVKKEGREEISKIQRRQRRKEMMVARWENRNTP